MYGQSRGALPAQEDGDAGTPAGLDAALESKIDRLVVLRVAWSLIACCYVLTTVLSCYNTFVHKPQCSATKVREVLQRVHNICGLPVTPVAEVIDEECAAVWPSEPMGQLLAVLRAIFDVLPAVFAAVLTSMFTTGGWRLMLWIGGILVVFLYVIGYVYKDLTYSALPLFPLLLSGFVVFSKRIKRQRGHYVIL